MMLQHRARAGHWQARSRRPRCSPVRALVAKDVTLPNGLTISCTSTPDEALFLYRENVVERVYLRHGVALRPGDTVVDVGANMGLFAMAAAEACGPSGRVVCFEPIPEVAAACRENLRRHAAWCAARGVGVALAEVVEAAVGDGAKGEAVFTVYPRASGWSTMAPDVEETLANMGAYIDARLAAVAQAGGASGGGSGGGGEGEGGSGGGLADQPVGALERLLLPAAAALHAVPLARGPLRAVVRGYVRGVMLSGARRVRCRVVSLGRAMEDLGIGRVSLLKVDVERAEIQVLSGIGPADWRRIDAVALEVHDLAHPLPAASDLHGDAAHGGTHAGSSGGGGMHAGGGGGGGGALGEVRALLAGAGGFGRVVAEQDAALAGTNLHNVYATRR